MIKPMPKLRLWILAGFALVVSIAAATVVFSQMHQPEKPSVAARPLDEVMPGDALLYIEARDFSALLKEWNDSPEKAFWLTSESRSVFSQSRLLLRLDRHFRRFGAVAGVPADTEFVTAAAGGESALALYDIGKIQFVYITHLRHPDFLNSALWQSRNKLQARAATGVTYFLGKDDDSEQVVAFAVAGDYLVLATREDLMVRTLQLLSRQPERSIRRDAWYSEAVAGAPQTRGDLHMVLNMRKLAFEPHFRTYWVQQNITEMQGYTAAVSDLYREANGYREERVLLRKPGAAGTNHASGVVSNLLRLLPDDYGFYRTQITDSDEALDLLRHAILPKQHEAREREEQAPQGLLTKGEVGSQSDLETRIDIPANNATEAHAGSSLLKKQIDQAGPLATLEMQATQRATDGVLLTMPNLLVIASERPWDLNALQHAIRSQLMNELSVPGLGFQWHQEGQAEPYYELEGLHPLFVAVRGKLLYVSNRAELLTGALRSSARANQVEGVTYKAGFNHARERGGFYEISGTLDRASEPKKSNGTVSSHFFSGNMAGLSRTLGRLQTETVVERDQDDKVLQTVTYTWSH
jgi:hypothetical protein